MGDDNLNSFPRRFGKFILRSEIDDLPQCIGSWWFASTAIPLLAATIGPLANVLSIGALVTRWKVTLPNNGQLPQGKDDAGVDISDPEWELILNAFSLAFGFVGNFFLLCNFTRRIRYIIALPGSIICWFAATIILLAIVVVMEVYEPPIRPGETYSQGYWHAVLACILYLIGSIILMINMLGYLLGHYPQHFELDDDQRTLILQTMMFFFWLAGGGAVFAKTSGINYANAVYFCDVTILTIGYGDFVPTNDLSRGLMLPYSIAGIIFLGLMINSIRKFAASMSRHNIIKKHELRVQTTTKAMSVSTDNELRAHFGLPLRRPTSPNEEPHGPTNAILHPRTSLERYGHVQIEGHTIKFSPHKPKTVTTGRGGAGRLNASILPHFVTSSPLKVLGREEEDVAKKIEKEVIGRIDRRRKVLLLKSDKDRFEEMRSIQQNTYKFRNYYQLSWSILAFSILWLAGAAVFMVAERREQDLSYFEALYFCYVSLLTIGYGDFAPRSNAGKPFFIVWSLIAIPTMTVLISNMGHTVIAAYNRGTFALADWTVMPKQGVVADFLRHHPRLKVWLVERARRKEERKRIRRGFPIANPDIPGTAEDVVEHPTLEKIASESMTESELARRLGLAIKRTATDMRESPPRRYTYEEWAEFTRLIRFTAETLKELQETEQKEGLVEWDWIGTDSPMLADEPEAEWILDRLIESLNRYMRYQARRAHSRMDRSHLIKKFNLHEVPPETDENGEPYAIDSGSSNSNQDGDRSNGQGGNVDGDGAVVRRHSNGSDNSTGSRVHWPGRDERQYEHDLVLPGHHTWNPALSEWEREVKKNREMRKAEGAAAAAAAAAKGKERMSSESEGSEKEAKRTEQASDGEEEHSKDKGKEKKKEH